MVALVIIIALGGLEEDELAYSQTEETDNDCNASRTSFVKGNPKDRSKKDENNERNGNNGSCFLEIEVVPCLEHFRGVLYEGKDRKMLHEGEQADEPEEDIEVFGTSYAH